MKRLILCLLVTLPFAGVRAAMLGADVSVMPPARWKTVEPYPEELAPSPFPTLKYVPADGGPASITVTLMPPDLLGFEVTDAESLELFTRIAAQPFCAADEPAPKPVTQEVTGGPAVSITTPYPREAGFAPEEGCCRMVTTAAVLLDEQHLVLFTIQHNGDGTPEFQRAMQMLRSVDLQAGVPSPMGSREIHALARAEPAVRP